MAFFGIIAGLILIDDYFIKGILLFVGTFFIIFVDEAYRDDGGDKE